MDYARIDREAVVEGFLLDNIKKNHEQFRINELEVTKQEFAAELRELAGKDPDPVLTMLNESSVKLRDDADKMMTRLRKRLSKKAVDDQQKTLEKEDVEWLELSYLPQLEAEHLQHTTLVEIATEIGDEDQVLSSTLALLAIEKAHELCEAKLAALKPEERKGKA